MRPTSLVLVVTILTAPSLSPARADGGSVPVGLAWGADGRLRVALRDARSVVVVEGPTRAVVERHSLAFRPASICALSDRRRWLIGGMDGEIQVLDADGTMRAIQSSTGRGPTRGIALEDGRWAVVSLWDPALHVLDARGRTELTIPLGFPPDRLALRPGGGLVVADAFAPRIASVDPASRRVRVRMLDGPNVGGLAVSADGRELLFTHVSQYKAVPVTGTNIDWGLVLSSQLGSARTSDLDADAPDGAPLPSRRLTLDGSNQGAAEPGALTLSRDGDLVVLAITGAHQVMLVDRTLGARSEAFPELPSLGSVERLETIDVGRNPVDVAIDPAGAYAVTADAMSDSLTFVSLRDGKVVATVAFDDPARARTAEQRGEALFHDGRRSMDRWMTCASCHPRGHTNGLAFDTLGDGGYGAAKSTPSLLGVGATAPYGWTGRFATLDEQVHQSLEGSLKGPTPSSSDLDDLRAYLQSLPPPPPRRLASDPLAARGAALFASLRCVTCHVPPSYASEEARDVGLDDGAGGHKAFNPPSLRGVGWSAPYFHDGRAASLDDVLKVHPRPSAPPLRAPDREALRAFLESL